MKKSIIAIALAMVLVFAFASSAYANGWIDWADAQATYAADNTGSPHSGYTTTTTKCEVCHAVHGANGNIPLLWGGSGDPVDGATNSCAYCHQTDSGGYVQVYYDNAGVISWAAYNTGSVFGNSSHGIQCSSCHAVHGAGVLAGAAGGYFAQYNLKDTGTLSNAPAGWKTSTDRYEAQTYFCAQCHKYYSDGQFNNTVWDSDGTAPAAAGGVASHPMVDPATSGFNYADGGNRGAYLASDLTVAWKESSECRDCHDAGTDNLATSGRVLGAMFPHYTQNQDGFLFSALNSAAATETHSYAVGIGSTAYANGKDGTCLKCHASATDGVGDTF